MVLWGKPCLRAGSCGGSSILTVESKLRVGPDLVCSITCGFRLLLNPWTLGFGFISFPFFRWSSIRGSDLFLSLEPQQKSVPREKS